MSLRVVLVTSIKGGVGKTTVSVGLARALRDVGHRVGVLDGDYRSPCVPLLLGQTGSMLGTLQHGSGDSLIPPMVEGLAVMSMGYIWPPDKCVMVEDTEAVEDVRQLLSPGVIAWPELDWLVIDTPPTSSGIVTTLLSVNSGRVGGLIVALPSVLSRATTLRTVDLFTEQQAPLYGIVCNQAGAPEAELGDGEILGIAEQFGLPLACSIPYGRPSSKELAQEFAQLTSQLVQSEPVVLKKKIYSEETWKRFVTASRQVLQATQKAGQSQTANLPRQ